MHWLTGRGASPVVKAEPIRLERPDGLEDWDEWTADPVSLQFLGGTQNRQIRSRQQIYQKWQEMLADPVIQSSLRLHVTAALGGHESKGEMVFVEATAEAKKDKKAAAFVATLAEDLQKLFNEVAPTVCFTALGFGDGYARMYTEKGKGVTDLYCGELVYPPIVQPYERGNKTIGYTIATGSRFHERLSVLQLARMKMPRMMYIPQNRVIEKAIRTSLTTDLLQDLPAVPSLAGGSFLDGAEGPYDKFNAAWVGLTGQRVQDSIDETMVSVQEAGMTKQHRNRFKAALERMFERSNEYINAVVQSGRPVFGKIIHFIPVASDKQLTQVVGATTSGRTSSLTIEDVMMNARFLAGVLGQDLSMIGFADQMGGGLGEGGFFRMSAQSAERSRAVRAALTPMLNHIVDVHVFHKFGLDFEGKDRPWTINYFSGISALEAERQKTKSEAMNSGALLTQTLASLKELGLDEQAAAHLLEHELGLDATSALMYAKALVKAAEEAKAIAAEGGGSFGAGEGGGGSGGKVPPLDLDAQEG